MAGRHIKTTLFSLHSSTIKTAGGVVAGAALAGAIAATSAAANPTPPTIASVRPAGVHEAVSGFAAIKRDAPMTAHAAHRIHAAHDKHNAHVKLHRNLAKRSSRKAHRGRGRGHEHRVTADQVIDLAKSQIGKGERSGVSKFNKWYMGDSRAKYTVKRDGGSLSDYKEAAWCDMFVSWVGDKLGVSRTMGFDAYTAEHARWFKKKGRWGHRPRAGSVAFFSWSGSNKIDDIEHVGFTIKDNGDGTIQTIEGNTDNTVAVRKRDKSNVVGYGYPGYRK